MTLTYTLNENDFLQHQLFNSSKSKRVKSQRRKTWIIYSLAMFFLSFMFYQSGNNFLTYYFLIFGFIFIFLFPLYQQWYYKRHYQKFVRETYKKRFNKISTITFNDNNIETLDRTGESKINLSEMDEIEETGGYFYLKMKTGEQLIIPKLQIKNIEDLKDKLQEIAEKFKVNFVSDLMWKWK